MLKANYTPLGDQFRKSIGGIANESRFAEKQFTRKRKNFTLPALNSKGIITFEQAWNRVSSVKDVVRLTVKSGEQRIKLVLYREDLEQIIFAMAQDEETIKYFKAEARNQRKWSEPGNRN